MDVLRGTSRKQVQMSKAIADWFKVEADKLGISQNSLIVMALKHYIDQQEVIQASKQVPDWLSIAQEIQAQEREKDEGK